MGTRINTNTLAMQAARYGGINDRNVSSSVEKLSSGLRINRAADDAAGLVISESLRAQVAGMDQAIRNSSEAANMVKTAEGALNEVHDLLRTMRTLATHAANTGANDATAVAADQAQIANAIKSLDRIASTTSFGSLKLLDGSASTKVDSNNANLVGQATGDTQQGVYRVDVTTAGVKGSSATAVSLQYGHAEATDSATAALASGLSAGATVAFTGNASQGITETVIVDLQGATTLQQVADKINNSATASKYVKASISTTNHLVFESKAAVATSAAAESFTVAFNSSFNASTVGFTAATVNNASTRVANADKLVMTDMQYTVQGMGRDGVLGAGKTFAIARGTSLSDVFKNFETFSKTNGLEADMSLNANGTIRLQNKDIGTNRGVLISGGSSDSLGLDARSTTASAVNMVLTVNGTTLSAADIDGSKVSITAASGLALKAASGLKLTLNAATSDTLSDGAVTVSGGALKFQVGANAGEQAEIQLLSASTDKLGAGAVVGKLLKDLDVTTSQGATDALMIIDKAIAEVSTQRANMGAFQSQVLESNIRSLGIAKENLAASESTIRDTDMATETVMFTKNNILVQASQAMLAQANNSSQGILQLLRG